MDVVHITTQDVLRVPSQDTDRGTLWESKTETHAHMEARVVVSEALKARGLRT